MTTNVNLPALGSSVWWMTALCLVVYVAAFAPTPGPRVRRVLTALGLACLGAFLFVFIRCDWWICCISFLCV